MGWKLSRRAARRYRKGPDRTPSSHPTRGPLVIYLETTSIGPADQRQERRKFESPNRRLQDKCHSRPVPEAGRRPLRKNSEAAADSARGTLRLGGLQARFDQLIRPRNGRGDPYGLVPLE